MRILAGDIATVGALCGEDAGKRVTIHFYLRALSIARTGRKKGHINGDHGVLMRSLSDLVEQAIDRFQPEVFADEENTAPSVGSRLLVKLQGVVEMICAERGVRFDLFNASQARKFALGDGGLDKLQAAAAVPCPAWHRHQRDDPRRDTLSSSTRPAACGPATAWRIPTGSSLMLSSPRRSERPSLPI